MEGNVKCSELESQILVQIIENTKNELDILRNTLLSSKPKEIHYDCLGLQQTTKDINIWKMQSLLKFCQNLMNETSEEIQERKTFTCFIGGTSKLNKGFEELKQCQEERQVQKNILTTLKKELGTVKLQLFDARSNILNTIFTENLERELKDVEQVGSNLSNYFDKYFTSKLQGLMMENDMKVQLLQNQLETHDFKMFWENRCSEEIQSYLTKARAQLIDELNQLEIYEDKLHTEKDRNMTRMKMQMETMADKMDRYETIMAEREKEMKAFRRMKAEEKAKEKSAILLQTWWRSVVVSKGDALFALLDKEKKKRKKGGKKGKKKKGKKKGKKRGKSKKGKKKGKGKKKKKKAGRKAKKTATKVRRNVKKLKKKVEKARKKIKKKKEVTKKAKKAAKKKKRMKIASKIARKKKPKKIASKIGRIKSKKAAKAQKKKVTKGPKTPKKTPRKKQAPKLTDPRENANKSSAKKKLKKPKTPRNEANDDIKIESPGNIRQSKKNKKPKEADTDGKPEEEATATPKKGKNKSRKKAPADHLTKKELEILAKKTSDGVLTDTDNNFDLEGASRKSIEDIATKKNSSETLKEPEVVAERTSTDSKSATKTDDKVENEQKTSSNEETAISTIEMDRQKRSSEDRMTGEEPKVAVETEYKLATIETAAGRPKKPSFKKARTKKVKKSKKTSEEPKIPSEPEDKVEDNIEIGPKKPKGATSKKTKNTKLKKKTSANQLISERKTSQEPKDPIEPENKEENNIKTEPEKPKGATSKKTKTRKLTREASEHQLIKEEPEIIDKKTNEDLKPAVETEEAKTSKGNVEIRTELDNEVTNPKDMGIHREMAERTHQKPTELTSKKKRKDVKPKKKIKTGEKAKKKTADKAKKLNESKTTKKPAKGKTKK